MRQKKKNSSIHKDYDSELDPTRIALWEFRERIPWLDAKWFSESVIADALVSEHLESED
jgi:hypothetical protein